MLNAFTINAYSTPPLFQHACQKSMMILYLTSSILENSFIMDYFTRLVLCVSVITYITTCINQAVCMKMNNGGNCTNTISLSVSATSWSLLLLSNESLLGVRQLLSEHRFDERSLNKAKRMKQYDWYRNQVCVVCPMAVSRQYTKAGWGSQCKDACIRFHVP